MIAAFVKIIDDLAVVADGSGPAEALEAVLEQTGYLEMLRSSNDPQDESRVENLAELVAVVRDFMKENPEGTLTDFLERVALVADADQIPEAPERRRGRQHGPPRGIRHPDDASHGQGARVPRGVPHRHGTRDLPAPAFDDRREGTGRGTPACLCGADPRP